MSSHRTAYVFSLIRYVHDVFGGEFLNVGVVALAPSKGQLEVRVSKNFVRIMQAFPRAQLGALSAQLDHLEKRLKSVDCASGLSFQSLIAKVLPADESCLQLSKSSSGVTSDLATAVTELFDRFVIKSEAVPYSDIEAYVVKRVPHQLQASRKLESHDESEILQTASNEENCYTHTKLELVS